MYYIFSWINDEKRQVTKPTSPLQSFRSRTEYLHSCSRSIAVAPDKRGGAHISEGVIFCNRKRELWSGNESGKTRYLSGSSVVGTSALSPGVLRQMYIMLYNVHMNMNALVRTGRASPTVQFCIMGHDRPVRTEAFIFIYT